jgi:hypothetical protein
MRNKRNQVLSKGNILSDYYTETFKLSVKFLPGSDRGLRRNDIVCEIWKMPKEYPTDLEAYGIAILREGDIYDELTGCKLALTKALDFTGLTRNIRKQIWVSLFKYFEDEED